MHRTISPYKGRGLAFYKHQREQKARYRLKIPAAKKNPLRGKWLTKKFTKNYILQKKKKKNLKKLKLKRRKAFKFNFKLHFNFLYTKLQKALKMRKIIKKEGKLNKNRKFAFKLYNYKFKLRQKINFFNFTLF